MGKGGAIDNAWEEIGWRRVHAEKYFLADAIAAVLGGREPPVARMEAVGCLFEKPGAEKSAGPTFTRDIAPVVFARCTNCHRDGQAAPFSLTSYAQTAKQLARLSTLVGTRTRVIRAARRATNAPGTSERLLDGARQLWGETPLTA